MFSTKHAFLQLIHRAAQVWYRTEKQLLTSDVRARGDPQQPTTATPEELAQLLLSSEIGAYQRAEDCVAAAVRLPIQSPASQLREGGGWRHHGV